MIVIASEGSKTGSVLDGKGAWLGDGDGVGVGDEEDGVDGVVSGAGTVAVGIKEGKVDSEVGTEGVGRAPQPVKRRSKTEKIIKKRKQSLSFTILLPHQYEAIITHYINPNSDI